MKGVFLRKTIGNTRNITAIMSMERRGDNRRRSVSGLYTYFGQYPAQNERFGVHGIPQRKKRIADIPEIRKHVVRIPKPRILVSGILR